MAFHSYFNSNKLFISKYCVIGGDISMLKGNKYFSKIIRNDEVDSVDEKEEIDDKPNIYGEDSEIYQKVSLLLY